MYEIWRPIGFDFGTVLFILVMYDLPRNLPTFPVQYVDDTTLVYWALNLEDLNLSADFYFSSYSMVPGKQSFLYSSKIEHMIFTLIPPLT